MGSSRPNMNVIMQLVAKDPGFQSQLADKPDMQRAVHAMAGLPMPPSGGISRGSNIGEETPEQQSRKEQRRSLNPLIADPQRFGLSAPSAASPGKGSPSRVNPLMADPQRFGLPTASIAPIISVPIPTNPLGNRIVPPPTEAQAQADYDYTLNTLKTEPVYPGASFANVLPAGYNTLENIAENQGMSPFDQSQRSTITGTTTGPLSQTTANPGNFGGSIISHLNRLNREDI